MTSRELKRRALRYATPMVVQKAMRWPDCVEAVLNENPHTWHWYSADMEKGKEIARGYNDRFRRIALWSLAVNGPIGVVVV